MPIHTRLLALVAVFAVANIAAATYIAAAPRTTPVTVTIAAASDDALPTPLPPTPAPPQAEPAEPTPPATPPTPTPTPQPTPMTNCSAALIVVPSANQPTGMQVPAVMKEIGRFALSYTVPTGCPAQATDAATIREVTASFAWTELSAVARRRAAITQLELRSADRATIYGKISSARASGSTTVHFRTTRLTVPVNGTREIVIVGNTTNVTGGSAVTVTTRISRIIAEIAISSDAAAGTLTYDGAPIAQQTIMTTGLDSGSPTGIQSAGTQREILRFWVTATGGEATIQTMKIAFEAQRDGQTIPLPVLRDVSISLQPEGFPKVGSWQVARNGTVTITNVNGFSGSGITPGQMKVIRVFADTTGAGTELPISLRASIVDLTARTTMTAASIRPTATMPVQGNWLSY